MTSESTESNLIANLIKDLSEAELEELINHIERGNEKNFYGLPKEAFMNIIRPQLASIKTKNVISARRLLYLPFEDLLDDVRGHEKERGKISRTSVKKFWQWVTEDIMPTKFIELANNFLEAQKKNNKHLVKKSATELGKAVAKEIKPFFDEIARNPEKEKEFINKLGGTKILEDAIEINKMLQISDVIDEIKGKLPKKPIYNLNNYHINLLRQKAEELSVTSPGAEIDFLLVVMKRLLFPYQILRVISAIMPNRDDIFISATEIGIIGNIVIENIEKEVQNLSYKKQTKNLDEQHLIFHTKQFFDAYDLIMQTLHLKRTGKWGERMLKAKSEISDIIEESILAGSENLIMQSIQPRDKNPFLDFENPHTENQIIIAETRAFSLNQLKPYLKKLGLSSRHNMLIQGSAKNWINISCILRQT